MEKWGEIYSKKETRVHDQLHIWLNTDYELHHIFHEVYKKNHPIEYEVRKNHDDDYYIISIEDLVEVSEKYHEVPVEDEDGVVLDSKLQNENRLKEAINKYKPDYEIRYSWWI